jgi:hypothetical protein
MYRVPYIQGRVAFYYQHCLKTKMYNSPSLSWITHKKNTWEESVAVLAVQLIPFLHFDLVVLYLVQVLKVKVQQMKYKAPEDKTLLLDSSSFYYLNILADK